MMRQGGIGAPSVALSDPPPEVHQWAHRNPIMADAVEWMTYTEIAETFGIGADSARNLVRRKRWSRQMGNDGLARIGVPTDQLPIKSSNSPTSTPIDPPIDGSTDAPLMGARGTLAPWSPWRSSGGTSDAWRLR
jgi:hypothetical protein